MYSGKCYFICLFEIAFCFAYDQSNHFRRLVFGLEAPKHCPRPHQVLRDLLGTSGQVFGGPFYIMYINMCFFLTGIYIYILYIYLYLYICIYIYMCTYLTLYIYVIPSKGAYILIIIHPFVSQNGWVANHQHMPDLLLLY
jgi:hypothetical protein